MLFPFYVIRSASLGLDVNVTVSEWAFGGSAGGCHLTPLWDSFSSSGYGSWLNVHGC